MCLIAFAWKAHPEYPLLISANRDEFYARPTRAAHFWDQHPDIFAGQDLQAGGTWLGISRTGRFAALTNIRNPKAHRTDAISRGLLVSDFLTDTSSSLEYAGQLKQNDKIYNGYNLIIFDGESLVYQTNSLSQAEILSPGIYAISNATLSESWPKTNSAKDKLTLWMNNPGEVEQLAGLLNDQTTAPDEHLPNTGIALELEKSLSSEFIQLPNYGTRCSTGVMIHKNNNIQFCEISHQDDSTSISKVTL